LGPTVHPLRKSPSAQSVEEKNREQWKNWKRLFIVA
jgi:hypothetical protein